VTAFVVYHHLCDAVNLGLDVAASDVVQDPKLSLNGFFVGEG
jgi:hypothetical protein